MYFGTEKDARTSESLYRSDVGDDFHGYVDSDFARDNVGRESTAGYLFQFASREVSCISKKHTIVALSIRKMSM